MFWGPDWMRRRSEAYRTTSDYGDGQIFESWRFHILFYLSSMIEIKGKKEAYAAASPCLAAH